MSGQVGYNKLVSKNILANVKLFIKILLIPMLTHEEALYPTIQVLSFWNQSAKAPNWNTISQCIIFSLLKIHEKVHNVHAFYLCRLLLHFQFHINSCKYIGLVFKIPDLTMMCECQIHGWMSLLPDPWVMVESLPVLIIRTFLVILSSKLLHIKNKFSHEA